VRENVETLEKRENRGKPERKRKTITTVETNRMSKTNESCVFVYPNPILDHGTGHKHFDYAQ